MLKLGRRKFMSLLGAGAVGGRQIVQEAAKAATPLYFGPISGPPSNSLASMLADDSACVQTAVGGASPNYRIFQGMKNEALRAAFHTKSSRDELESLLYAQFKAVNNIDYDIALKRSWSMAAKLCYQRQRNVEDTMRRELEIENWYFKIESWKEKILRAAGLFV